MSQDLIYRQDGAISIVQLNRPAKKNSLNRELRRELRELLNELAKNKNVRAVIFTGGEEIFCAGADISEITDVKDSETGYHQPRDFQTLFDLVESLPQPVIAAVSGYALGGGCELALACDFRFASETARFGLSEIRIGIFPAGGGTQRLPRLIGPAKAKEMIMTGEQIDAQQALSLGLVTKVVPKEKLLEEARAYAEKLVALPRLSLEVTKMLINRGLDMDLASGLELEARCLSTLATTDDFREGIRAFLEKRKPNFGSK